MGKLGYIIIYVTDVAASMRFYRDAFGFQDRFVHESGDYGEMATGETTLAFAAHAIGEGNLPAGYTPLTALDEPAGLELAVVCDDVAAALAKVIEVGGVELQAPSVKPWGQTVAYARAPDGVLLELCTPMTAG